MPYLNFTYTTNKLISACKAFLCLNARLDIKFLAFFIPNLIALIMLPYKVSTNLVIKHTKDSTFSIFNWLSNV